MKLTTAQISYLDGELFDRSRVLIDKYYADRDNLARQFRIEDHGLATDQYEAGIARKLATDLVSLRANTFIEVFQELNLFPDEEDYLRFREVSFPIVVTSTMDKFTSACNSAPARQFSASVAQAIARTLPMELQTIFTHGMKPVESFLRKGMAKKDMKKTYSQREAKVLKMVYKLADGVPIGMIEIDKIAARMEMPSLELNTYLLSLEDKGFLGSINEAVWLTADGAREIEDEKPLVLPPSRASTTNFHINAPVGAIQNQTENSTQNVTQAIQLTNNPDFDKAIQAITEIVKLSELADEDKREALGDIATLSRLAADPERPGIAVRALAKIASLDTLLKLTPIGFKVAEHWPAIKGFFESL